MLTCLFVKNTLHFDKYRLPCGKISTVMKTRFLLPHRYKMIGWIIVVPAFVLMIFNLNYGFTFNFLDFEAKNVHNISFDNGFLFNIQFNNFTDELGGLLLITGLLILAFSRERFEDERISRLRLESLLWAVFLNSLLIMISIIFFYNELFLKVMAYNICTPLILFIARFNLLLYYDRKKLKKEDQ